LLNRTILEKEIEEKKKEEQDQSEDGLAK